MIKCRLLFIFKALLGHTPISHNLTTLRNSSYYATQIVKPLSKFVLRGEVKNPLKYIMNIFLLDFEYFIEKKLASKLEFGIPFFVCANSCRQKCQKVLLYRHFRGLSSLHFGH